MAKRKGDEPNTISGFRGASEHADFRLPHTAIAGVGTIDKNGSASAGTLLNLLSRLEKKINVSIEQIGLSGESGIPEDFMNALACIQEIRRFHSFGGWRKVKVNGVNRCAPLPEGQGVPLDIVYDMFLNCIALGLCVGGIELIKCESDAKRGKRMEGVLRYQVGGHPYFDILDVIDDVPARDALLEALFVTSAYRGLRDSEGALERREKNAGRNADMLEAYEALAERNPYLSHKALCRKVGEQFDGKSWDTVDRVVPEDRARKRGYTRLQKRK